MNYQSGVTLQNHLFWCCSPAEHIRRQHPLGLQGTSGAGHAKPDYQSGGFPGPFVCCQVRTACCVQGTVRQWWQQIAFILNIFFASPLLPPPLPGPPSTPETAAGPPEGRGARRGEAERGPATTRETKSQLYRGPGPCVSSK